MATVSKWTPFGVALDITATGGTVTRTSATKFTVKINASWETYYSGAATKYGMIASSGGSSVTLKTFSNTAASSGSGSFTGTYSISGNGAATKTITVTFRNFNDDNGDSATKNVTFNVSVPAWTSYTVTYNANVGSGAPGSQTKWKDQTLTLSSTKPTRTGYSFLGWSTSSSATSATYSAGGSYTANSAVTLYAVWKANTYTVSYNANGGSGAPGNQTKTYGVTLTLSSTKPARTNYTFKGWGTSASATTVSYAAGASYTKNAAITLYAVWELSYKKPRIVNLSVVRANSGGTEDDTGTNALVTFDWACDKSVTSVTLKWKPTSETEWTSTSVSTSGTSGTISKVIGSNNLSIESSYDIYVTVSDSGGSSYNTGTLTSMKFTVDYLAGGRGVAFGKAAELKDTVEFEFDAKFNGLVYGNALGLGKLPSIPANDDLNNYMETGCYGIYRSADATTISNMPPTAVAGRLEVLAATGEGVRSSGWSYLRQRFIPYDLDYPVWERDISRSDSNTWDYGAWVATSLRGHKVLWSGAMTMHAAQTIDLSANPISKQPSGIMLIFSRYNTSNSTPDDGNFNHFFVSKKFVELMPGKGSAFNMTAVNFSYICTKYLYIGDTYITGNDLNSSTGTNNGVTYANNGYALRYVLGV